MKRKTVMKEMKKSEIEETLQEKKYDRKIQ